MEWNKEHRGNILLRSDQRSCEHILTALSSLVIEFARLMTLALEMAGRELRTLLSLPMLTLLCSNMMTGQRFQNKKPNKKTDFDGVGGWGFEAVVLMFPSP